MIAGIPVAGTQHIGEIGHLPLQIVHVILQLVDLADALFHQICRVIGNGRRTVHAYVGAQQKTSQSDDDEHRNASQQRALRAVFAYVPEHDFPSLYAASLLVSSVATIMTFSLLNGDYADG